MFLLYVCLNDHHFFGEYVILVTVICGHAGSILNKRIGELLNSLKMKESELF